MIMNIEWLWLDSKCRWVCQETDEDTFDFIMFWGMSTEFPAIWTPHFSIRITWELLSCQAFGQVRSSISFSGMFFFLGGGAGGYWKCFIVNMNDILHDNHAIDNTAKLTFHYHEYVPHPTPWKRYTIEPFYIVIPGSQIINCWRVSIILSVVIKLVWLAAYCDYRNNTSI